MHERVKVVDYAAFGKLVVQWASDEGSRPKSNKEFRDATAGILQIPDRITADPVYPQWTVDNLVIRLPDPTLVSESMGVLGGHPAGYPLGPFYQGIIEGTVTGTEALLSRIGDYTIAQCT